MARLTGSSWLRRNRDDAGECGTQSRVPGLPRRPTSWPHAAELGISVGYRIVTNEDPHSYVGGVLKKTDRQLLKAGGDERGIALSATSDRRGDRKCNRVPPQRMRSHILIMSSPECRVLRRLSKHVCPIAGFLCALCISARRASGTGFVEDPNGPVEVPELFKVPCGKLEMLGRELHVAALLGSRG